MSIDARRADPHLSGAAICGHCGHEWTAVVPVGVFAFECPSCQCQKGVMRGYCAPENGALWHCTCGCMFFVYAVYKDDSHGMMCANCGEWQTGHDS